MAIRRAPTRLFIRLAMLPVGMILFAMAPVFKNCLARARTPCAKLVEEDEVEQMSGVKATDVRLSEHDDSCSATYEDYFHRSLFLVDVRKNGSSEYGSSFAKSVKDMEAKPETVASERVEGLDDEAFLVEIQGNTKVELLLVNRSAQGGYISFYFYPGSFRSSFSREDVKKLLPLIKPRLALADDYLATRKSY